MAKIMQNGKCYGSDNSKDIRYDNTNSNMKATNTQDAIDELNESLTEQNKNLESFQNGVDSIVSTCTTYGSTPSANTPSAINTSIRNIYNNRYSEGLSAAISTKRNDYCKNFLTMTTDSKTYTSGNLTLTNDGYVYINAMYTTTPVGSNYIITVTVNGTTKKTATINSSNYSSTALNYDFTAKKGDVIKVTASMGYGLTGGSAASGVVIAVNYP